MDYTDFLLQIFQDEIVNRSANSFKKNLKAANFGQPKTLNGFDFKFNKDELSPSLLILDDFALKKLSFKEAEFFYDLIDERLGNGSLIITSNRAIQDWIGIFPDPVSGDTIMDRIVSNAHKIIATAKAKSFRKEGKKNHI